MERIYAYTDYRAFLRDAYQTAKAQSPIYSYRYFAKRAGFTSPNFLQLVIEGKRNLSPESVHRFAQVFKLGRREQRFFEVLVQFNQAKTPTEQHHYYQQLLEFPEYCQAQPLAAEQYEYLTHWYYPVIQELVTLPDFSEDPAWLVRRLGRRITARDAVDAIATLLRLGLLQRDAHGRLQPTHQHLTTGDEARGAAASAYHEQMLEQAKVALREQSAQQREYGALTVALNAKQLTMLKGAIRDFRKVVLNLLTQPGEIPTMVYQLNIQLFAQAEQDGKEAGV